MNNAKNRIIMPKAINTETRTLNFEGLMTECKMCEDGREYSYTETCPTCNGKKRLLKVTRVSYKCKTCGGEGFVRRAEKVDVGPCKHCKGTRKVSFTAYDDMSDEDRLWVFENLFNFDKPYEGKFNTFDEDYLGMTCVCGVTDYGRYKEYNEADFKKEVKKYFLNGWLQYVSILKNRQLPKEILIRKGNSGWFAYPTYN